VASLALCSTYRPSGHTPDNKSPADRDRGSARPRPGWDYSAAASWRRSPSRGPAIILPLVYVKAWGVPKGIDRLSLAEARQRSRSFKITTAGLFGPVLSMEAVDSAGEPVNGIQVVSKFSPAEDDTAVSRLEYGYDSTAQRTVAYEISMDIEQHLVSRMLYIPLRQPRFRTKKRGSHANASVMCSEPRAPWRGKRDRVQPILSMSIQLRVLYSGSIT
jgi:hypothetical protein